MDSTQRETSCDLSCYAPELSTMSGHRADVLKTSLFDRKAFLVVASPAVRNSYLLLNFDPQAAFLLINKFTLLWVNG